ncbi:MAG: hypothetical protein AABX53_00780 [Nanoarchaeota archaeon]
MKIEVTIGKRALLVFAGFAVLLGVVFVYAATPNPGHDASMTGDGSGLEPFGGKSTFAGGVSAWYAFPGHLGIGNSSIHRGNYQPELFINSSDGYTGMALVANGSGDRHQFIDFIYNGIVKANIDYAAQGGVLLINGNPSAAATKVGLNKSVPTVTFDVGGTSKADKLCIGDDCKVGWGVTRGYEDGIGNARIQLVSNSGIDDVVTDIAPYREDFDPTVGGARFCALSQTYIDPKATGGGGQCSVEKVGGMWKLNAYRTHQGVEVVCSAYCIMNTNS